MSPAVEIVSLVVAAATIAGLSKRWGAPAPLVLVGVGVICSFIGAIPQVNVDPHVILIGLLPPLLYSAAVRTSLVDFRANRQAIVLLSVGCVAFSTVAVGLIAWWVIPAIPLAAAFALGAVVAPPDAVAASAVARRVGMPRNIVSILEGESLVNDATALVALNTAIAAITSNVTAWHVGGQFLLAAGGGVGVGLVAAFVLAKIRKVIEEPVLDTTLSFAAPYVAFLPAEAIHSSGVLAVVVTGLVLGHKSTVLQSATARIAENINWRTVEFVLENVVFLLIGLQLQQILEGVHARHLAIWTSVWVCLAVLLATIVARAVWVLGAVLIYRIGTPSMRRSAWGWAAGIVISWAGMRGVVTLAAVFLLPAQTPNRDLLRLAAFTVVVGTLVLQGLSLPWLIRRLHLPAPDPAEDALQSASLITESTRAGLARLDEIAGEDVPEDVLEQLRRRAATRANVAWERLGRPFDEYEPPAVVYQRLRVQMLAAERDAILRARDTGQLDDEILRSALNAVDMEESLLERIDDAVVDADAELTPVRRAAECEHLLAAPRVAIAKTPGECQDCIREGMSWVHLRMCLGCGQVGCCDSSVGNHARKHFQRLGHPVMRSVEPGEAWRWCYVDAQLG
jgi:monovalent cation/hydrogen antiporter